LVADGNDSITAHPLASRGAADPAIDRSRQGRLRERQEDSTARSTATVWIHCDYITLCITVPLSAVFTLRTSLDGRCDGCDEQARTVIRTVQMGEALDGDALSSRESCRTIGR